MDTTITRETATRVGLSKDIIDSLEDVFERLERVQSSFETNEELETALFAIRW